MTDIGDEVLIETEVRVDDVLFDPSSVVLTVTDPAGTISNPSVNTTGTGLYNSIITVNAAGRWHWKWATNNPTTVDHGYIDVSPDPPSGLLPLATVLDCERRIGTLSAAQAARAPALLEDASALVRAETRLKFARFTDDVIEVRSTGKVIRLPQRPVIDVTQVAAIGVPPSQDLIMPSGTWSFDGIDAIELVGNLGWVINLPEVWSTDDWAGVGSYRVTYSHGHETVPAEIRGLVASMVNRTLTAPSVSDLVSESIGSGDYAWQAQQGVGAMGASVRLTQGDRDKLVSWGYIRGYGTTETVLR